MGTGGVSGTIMLESVPGATGNGFQYYNDKFSFVYPIAMFEKDPQTQAVKEKKISNYTELRTYLMSLDSNAPYAFKYPLSLVPIGQSQALNFDTAQHYQSYLASENQAILWKKIGSDNGFKVGFKSFDISYRQNKIVSSNIAGVLEIANFKYPVGHPNQTKDVLIEIAGHLGEEGEFNLTANVQDYPIRIPDIFTYSLKTVELGREGDGDFYLGTSGVLQFDGLIKEIFDIGPIEIERLRIYSDGSIDFQGGGSINLIKPIVDEFESIGMKVTIREKEKKEKTNIDSAFLKSETLWKELVLEDIVKQAGIKPTNRTIKIKIEVDRQPPLGFTTEMKLLTRPFSFYVKCFDKPSLFAGKMHALLFRKWQNRVKGRDWYDLEWYIRKGIPLDLHHFMLRAKDTGHWEKDTMTADDVLILLKEKFKTVNFESVKEDVLPFIKDDTALNIWGEQYFNDLIEKMKFQ